MSEIQDYQAMIRHFKKQSCVLAEKRQQFAAVKATSETAMEKLCMGRSTKTKELAALNERRYKMKEKLHISVKTHKEYASSCGLVRGKCSAILKDLSQALQLRAETPQKVLEELKEGSLKMENFNFEEAIEEYQKKAMEDNEALKKTPDDLCVTEEGTENEVSKWEKQYLGKIFLKSLGDTIGEVNKTKKFLQNIATTTKQLQDKLY